MKKTLRIKYPEHAMVEICLEKKNRAKLAGSPCKEGFYLGLRREFNKALSQDESLIAELVKTAEAHLKNPGCTCFDGYYGCGACDRLSDLEKMIYRAKQRLGDMK